MSMKLLRQYLFGSSGAPQGVPGRPQIFSYGDLRDLRLGANVDFSPALAKFVLAEDAKAMFQPPSESQRVLAYGRIEDGDFIVHRFYLGAPDKEPAYTLEIVTKDGNVVEDEIKLYQQVADFAPASPEEWDGWLVGNDQTPPLLGGIYLEWQDQEFVRTWGTNETHDGPPRADRRELEEEITGGEQRETVSLSAMLYGRMIGNENPVSEWLSVAMVQRDGDNGEEQWIEAYLGINLSIGDFTIY